MNIDLRTFSQCRYYFAILGLSNIGISIKLSNTNDSLYIVSYTRIISLCTAL